MAAIPAAVSVIPRTTLAFLRRIGGRIKPKKHVRTAAQRYHRYSLISELFGVVLLCGLVVELGFAFFLEKPWLEKVSDIIEDVLIVVGVWGELQFARLAREAGDATQREADARIAEADLRRIQLETALAPRVLTKRQYDTLQKLRGKIAAINVAHETDAEPSSFATQVAVALQAAGIRVGGYTRAAGVHGNANMLFDRHAFHNPDGEPTKGEPIASILREAGIDCTMLIARMLPDIGAPEDTPLIIIGGPPFPVVPSTPAYLGSPEA